MSEEMNRVSHALCALNYALLGPSRFPSRKVRQCLVRAFSPLLSAVCGQSKHTPPRHDACNHRALLISRATLRTSRATCRSFASPKRRRRLFLLRGARDQRNERGEGQTRRCWWPAGAYPPIVRFTERGIHGAGDEPHCPIPLITGLEYKAAPDGAVHLPPPDIRGHDSPRPFEWVVAERRCCRDFAELPSGHLHLWEIAQLSWAAQGITAPETAPDEFGHAG